jgi:hypothetical protein
MLWLYPTTISQAAIGIVLTWVYGILAARLLRMILQWGIMRWGVSRGGVIVLGLAMTACGVAIAYFGWQESVWFYVALGWVIAFAGFDSAYAAYRGRMTMFYVEMINDFQYLLVALFMLAVFGGNVADSQLAKLGLEYQGVPAESLIFLALVMAWAEIAHGVGMYFENLIESIFDN